MEELIKKLGLLPHPEGGFYKEMYRSEEYLETKERNLLTSIYFLLTAGNVSRFHTIKSDELWYFHQGQTVIVHTINDNGYQAHLLGNDLSKGEKPYLMVPANTLFGSSIKDDNGYALVSCAVAPGFDFRDFELPDRKLLLEKYPQHSSIIEKLTYPDPSH
jgi:predicted cupin superfamily sugar epimerase